MIDRALRLRLRAVLLVVALVGASGRAASALDEAGSCFQQKMRASRVGAAAWLRCGASGDVSSSRGLRCLAKADARVRRLLDVADAKAAQKGFVCPGSAESLGLAGPLVWPLRLLDSTDGGAAQSCRRLRASALRHLATDYGRCVEQGEALGTPDPGFCEEIARAAFAKSWAATGTDCDAVDADTTADSVESEVEETASRLRVTCSDGRVGGFEECDDGGVADGDGCSADCRKETCSVVGGQTVCSVCPGGCGPETCARVEGEVRCIACPADSVPAASYQSCRCNDGFAGQPGSCGDVDECAQLPDPCAGLGPCVNLEGSFACATACTAEAFHAALASCGAPSGTIAFDCSNTVIALPGGATASARDISCDELTIDGAGRGITFELAPLCWQTPLDASLCPGGLQPDGTCFCPNVDAGDPFLVLRGDRNVVRDLTIRGFFEGVHTRGRDNVVENVRFERICDDAFGNGPGGAGNLFRDLVVREGCDKCSESTGSVADTDADPRLLSHYNAVLRDVDFDTCLTPVRVASAGRYLLDGVTMAGGNAQFPCDGPRFSSGGAPGDLAVTVLDSRIEGCRRGLRFGTASEGVVEHSRIAGCSLRGLRVAPTARVSVANSTIEGNGGSGSAEDGFGGVAVLDGGQLDLGGGSVDIDGALRTSAGGNTICDNLGANDERLELSNATAGATPAAGNWWCSVDPAADRIAGAAVVEPLLSRAPDSYITAK